MLNHSDVAIVVVAHRVHRVGKPIRAAASSHAEAVIKAQRAAIPTTGSSAEIDFGQLKSLVIKLSMEKLRLSAETFFRHLSGGVVFKLIGISARHAIAEIARDAAQPSAGAIACRSRTTRHRIVLREYMTGVVINARPEVSSWYGKFTRCYRK